MLRSESGGITGLSIQRAVITMVYAFFIITGVAIGVWFNWIIIRELGLNRFIGYMLILLLCCGCCVVCHDMLNQARAGEADE